MDRDSNLKHWENWASVYGTSLPATTKCQTIKRIELYFLQKHLQKLLHTDAPRILEVGCGVGFNILHLSQAFPDAFFYGLDYSEKMIQGARSAAEKHLLASSRLHFKVMDARALAAPIQFEPEGELIPNFDVVYTDRMLINLASLEEQLEVMRKIINLIKPGGFFLMLENSIESHACLNEVRLGLGLPKRAIAEYNIFIHEQNIINSFQEELNLLAQEYISGFHDLILYAIAPSLSEGEIQYDSDLMKTVTDAILRMNDLGIEMPKGIGQNVLWVWQKR